MGDAQFPRTYVTQTQIMFSNMVATAVVAKRENMLGGGEHFVSGAPTVSGLYCNSPAEEQALHGPILEFAHEGCPPIPANMISDRDALRVKASNVLLELIRLLHPHVCDSCDGDVDGCRDCVGCYQRPWPLQRSV